ncbi:MAG: hypothetical protein IT427_11410 [Pirellulales bacterium]|nr:hypothetical protein [Pirellulales bacterium]
MDRRFKLRKEDLLAEAEVDAGWLRGTLERLVAFIQPFTNRLWRTEQVDHGLDLFWG